MASKTDFFRWGGGGNIDLKLASQDPVAPLSPFPGVCGAIKAEGNKRNQLQ